MATREEIGLAIDVIKLVNQMGRAIRSSASGILASQNTKIQAVIDDPAKQAKLVAGLAALDVTVTELNADKTAIAGACQYILDNVPEIVNL